MLECTCCAVFVDPLFFQAVKKVVSLVCERERVCGHTVFLVDFLSTVLELCCKTPLGKSDETFSSTITISLFP